VNYQCRYFEYKPLILEQLSDSAEKRGRRKSPGNGRSSPAADGMIYELSEDEIRIVES